MTAGRRRWWASDAAWVQCGCVLAAWIALLFAENLFVGLAFRTDFAGSWETREARRWVLPIALAALAPCAAVLVTIARLAEARRAWMAGLAFAGGGAMAVGVSNGRHLTSIAVRAPFVLAVAGAASFAAWWLVPRVARLSRERPRVVALLGGVCALVFWSCDAHVLPRLYPAFHEALFALTLASSALVALALRADDPRERAPSIVASLALALSLAAIVLTPGLARQLAGADNLRFVLVERAPIHGRAVTLAARLAPPAPLDDALSSSSTSTGTDAPPGELPRALDWTGRDVVLITVDALRADHVGAYGYARPTTPNLDALARSGARFDAAYCPTPHTSYSIASLMTGKYMRPLVAMGLGDDSDTWAGLLRRYGYRTAAFYPPAIFFIDGDRFGALRERGLDFEYRKEEFASPELRAREVAEYLASAPKDRPLFLWVHFFEPHEPYVAHAGHDFGSSDVDRYDSEIAAADEGIGAIVGEVRASRPNAVVIATADHGEEFGEHGGRYHGTTVYEEQVRVPLIVTGGGVGRGAVASVVQTIDLLPTVLSAVGIPRPARVRGRDLGTLLVGAGAGAPAAAANPQAGLAFAETDEYTMLARGSDRLVCARRASACAMYDVAEDPGERRDVAGARPADARDLRRALARVASEHGRFERGEGAEWPEAIRRGVAGDADAAEDVATLLDDANAGVRVKAAEVSFDLHAPGAAPAMRRALARTDDDLVRRWSALALLRMGDPEPPAPLAEALAKDPDPSWRRRAALAFAERGDARGALDLAAWWGDHGDADFVRATELLAAIAKIRDRAAVPALGRSLDDVRLRAYVSDALAAIGDPSARPALEAVLAREAQVTARAHEARALLALHGASWSSATPAAHVATRVVLPRGAVRVRLVVLASQASPCDARADGASLGPSPDAIEAHVFDLDAPRAPSALVTVDAVAGVSAIFALAAPAPSDAGE